MSLAATLEFDDMLAGLQRWVECESPTFDIAAVNRMMTLASDDLVAMGANVERVAGPAGLGDCLKASFPHPRQAEGGILIMAHLDTVHPVGTLETLPFRRDGDRCYGPGICDMKGGTYAALRAVVALQQAGVDMALPIHVLLTCDEEIGSPGTRELIEREAARHRYILVPEPARAGNGVITGRYAIARFELLAHGRPSHAGAALADGHSAIREMVARIPEIESMTNDDCTFSVGVVQGGQWVNCVSTNCRGEALSMAKRQADLDRGIERMLALTQRDADGIGFEVKLGVVRPVWEAGQATLSLYAQASRVADELKMPLPHASSGGGSDGNFTGAMGLPTLDGLGVRGAGIHTLDEHIEVDSLIERARLMAGLMTALR
ncbi:M20/M25/M40 family metallo-hydrolase [Salinicola socius]|uniref:Carboxypeptidase n=1 Tax=Salinicola socius TaxID=404433 RepID=A0A1Q8SSL5_9GAMM|nr:M20/M25/M40 family metallo-hydrolase [Salinicola socius]OLO04421.1 carboxypeptidase [Salinicola socius]